MLRFLSLFALLLLASGVSAQNNEEVRRILLTDGSIYVGTVADEDADPVVFVDRDGVRREFPRARVRDILPLINGRFFRTDPVKTRLLIAPTARTQGAGEFRGDLTGFLPSVTYGVSDRVDLLGSGYFTFGDNAVVSPLIGVKGQVLRTESAQVALGLSSTFTTAGDGGFGAIPYVVATIGDETGGISFGAAGAFGSAGDGLEVSEGLVFGLGGDRQINNGIKLFVESYVGVSLDGSSDVAVLVIPGVRFFGNDFAFDLIGIIATDFNDVIGFAPIPARVSYRF